jgi:hypothetical protein
MNATARPARTRITPLLAMVLCVALGGGARVALAEPYLAVQQGYKCIACHVNPTGGGLRNSFGLVFAENVMPATTLPAGVPVWLGQAVQDIIRVGGDLRTDWSRTTVPQSPTQQQFALEQFRLYADVTVIPNLLGLYVDEEVAPGAAQTMEAYARYGNTSDWYIKAGHFYLPFGWRLQDQTAFVRTVTGINMTTPDNGVEFGFERPNWSGQIDVTNGAANAGTGSGYQVTGNLVRVESIWRIGVSSAYTHADAGDRSMYGLYAGVRTGPVTWLSEIDLVRQAGYPNGTRTMIPALAEANWLICKGNNLKLTYEYSDPERGVPNNAQTRWSAVYELTPIPFLQARAGFRRYQGIPQNNLQNETFGFVELHLFL